MNVKYVQTRRIEEMHIIKYITFCLSDRQGLKLDATDGMRETGIHTFHVGVSVTLSREAELTAGVPLWLSRFFSSCVY